MATATTTDIATTDLPGLLAELRRTRARAEAVLAEIRKARQERPALSAERDGSDTFRRLAGRNSLELAERDAERVIATIDRRLKLAASASDLQASMTDWVRGR